MDQLVDKMYRPRLIWQLSIIIALVIFSATLFRLSLQLSVEYSQEKENLITNVNQVVEGKKNQIRQALWAMNDQSLQASLQGIRAIESVTNAMLVDESLPGYMEPKISSYSVVQSYPIVQHHRGVNVFLGTVLVTISMAEMRAAFYDQVIIDIKIAAIELLLIFVVLLLVIRKRVIRPLERVVRHTAEVAAGETRGSLALLSEDEKTLDELDYLLHSINTMTGQLLRQQSSLQTSLLGQRYELLKAQDMGVVGSFTSDKNGAVIDCSGKLLEILQYDETVDLESIDEIASSFDESDRSRVDDIIRSSHLYMHAYDFRAKLRLTNGAVKYVHLIGSPQSDGYMHSTLQDVTEFRSLEMRLKRTSVVVDNAAEGIVFMDEYGEIILVNPAFTDITGYELEDVEGMSMSMLNAGSNVMPLNNYSYWSGVKKWQEEVTFRRGNGQLFPVWLTISPVRDSDYISHYVAVFSDITPIRESQEAIQFHADHDSLTNLPNRMMMQTQLDLAVKRAQRHHSAMAVLFIDLDRFKEVNDTYGHLIGDELLIETSDRLISSVRDNDLVARLGGDEFVVILEDVLDVSVCEQVATKIVDQVVKPYFIEGLELTISASVGISIYPDDGADSTSLLKNADSAMYNVKQAGRNNVSFYRAAG